MVRGADRAVGAVRQRLHAQCRVVAARPDEEVQAAVDIEADEICADLEREVDHHLQPSRITEDRDPGGHCTIDAAGGLSGERERHVAGALHDRHPHLDGQTDLIPGGADGLVEQLAEDSDPRFDRIGFDRLGEGLHAEIVLRHLLLDGSTEIVHRGGLHRRVDLAIDDLAFHVVGLALGLQVTVREHLQRRGRGQY